MINSISLILLAHALVFGSNLYAKGVLSIGHNEVTNDNANINQFNSSLTLDLTGNKTLSTKYSYSYALNVRKYNNDDSAPLVSLPHFFIKRNFRNSLSVSLGRKLVDWNQATEQWSLGEVSSTKGFDLINDENEGLTGLHLHYKNSIFNFDFFGSGFFIPSLNPALKIGDGKILARSEWSALPPQYVSLEGQLLPIEYNVDIPNLNKLLLKESFALRLGVDILKGRFSIYGGRKPENSFRVNATGFLAQRSQDAVVVNARPFTNMHNYLGTSWTNQWSDKLKTSLGLEAVRPDRGIGERYEIGGFAVEPTYNNVSYGSFLLQYKDDSWGFNLSHLKAFETYVTSGEAFAKRLRYNNATSIAPYFSVNDNINLRGKYVYDHDKGDHIFFADGSYRLTSKILFSLRYQMIDVSGDDSFWSRYQENDLWRVSLAFNF